MEKSKHRADQGHSCGLKSAPRSEMERGQLGARDPEYEPSIHSDQQSRDREEAAPPTHSRCIRLLTSAATAPLLGFWPGRLSEAPTLLLMTLGPGILLLGVLDWANLPVNSGGNSSSPSLSPGSKYSFLARPFIILGRVPMFYYLLHLPLIHLLAVLVALPHYQLALGSFYYARPPVDSGYGHELWVVYFVWVLAVLLLFPLCKWFARVKQQHRQTWLSYL